MRRNRLLVFIVLLAFLAGCNDVQILYAGSNMGNQITGSYRYFQGTETKSIEMDSSEVYSFNYSSEVASGGLSIQLLDPDGTTAIDFKTDTSGTIEYTAEVDGKHTLVIIGNGTRGKFSVSWE